MGVLKQNNFLIKVVISSLFATLFALVTLLVFSLIASATGASGLFLKIFNLLVRYSAVALAVYLSCDNQKGILKGGLSGVVAGIFVQLLFLIFSKSTTFYNFALNCIFCLIFGAILGIIFANLKKHPNNS